MLKKVKIHFKFQIINWNELNSELYSSVVSKCLLTCSSKKKSPPSATYDICHDSYLCFNVYQWWDSTAENHKYDSLEKIISLLFSPQQTTQFEFSFMSVAQPNVKRSFSGAKTNKQTKTILKTLGAVVNSVMCYCSQRLLWKLVGWTAMLLRSSGSFSKLSL